jgi:Domain of unknown function (DUF1707)
MVSDHDRDRVVALLRERYARGQLTVEELADRTGAVLAARSRGELLGVVGGLATDGAVGELLDYGRGLARGAARVALLVACTGAYLVFTLGLVLALVLTALIHGTSAEVLLGFAVAWLVPTYLLARLWHRSPPPRRPAA